MSIEGIRSTVAVAPVEAVQLRAMLDAVGVKPGEVVAARVAAMLSDGIARLAIAGGTLDVRTGQRLEPGAVLNLTVERQGGQLRLLLAGTAQAGPESAAPPAQSARPAQAAAPSPPQAPGTSQAPAAPSMPAVPGMATAAGALVDLIARGILSPQRGGILDGAQTVVAARGSQEASRRAEAAAGPRPREPQVQGAQVQGALAGVVRAAAGRQESLAPLFSELTALAGGKGQGAALPGTVRAAADDVLAFRMPGEALARPQGLALALRSGGTLLEARLAGLEAGAPLPPDLKAALLKLRTALAGWAAGMPADADTDAKLPRAAPHERPPLRGALPHGQPPAAASLAAGAGAAETARLLLDRTEAALARITLLQAASLPDAREAARPNAPYQATVEVPLRLGSETAIVPFQIRHEPEDGAPSRQGGRPAGEWIMRFSLDAEPLGPVHAAIRWREGRVGIQLWAERDGVAAALAASQGDLSQALEASAFAIDHLTVAAGRPPEPREPAPAPRLDLSS